MKKLLLASVAGFTLVATPVNAQSMDEAKQLMDVWLAAQTDYNDWPSIAVSFVSGQEKVYANAFGLANRGDDLKATPDTLYSICSISKLFTSIAMMQQRDAGRVALRDPVSKHLDWYNVEQKYPLSDEVTIEGILSHSSGLPREVDTPYWSASEGFPFPKRDDAKTITQSQETLYRAWEHFQYSNLGLTLAGEIVAKASGQDYHSYVRANVLDPLGMNNTYSEMPKAKHGNELAIGYGAIPRKGERAVVPFYTANAIAPAAGYASSANDLATFAMWQLKLREGEGDNVLNHNTLREMQRPNSVVMGWRGAFGIGFSLRNVKGNTLIGHGGSCPGYRTQIWIDPAKKIGGAALVNAGGVNPGQIIERMMAVFGPAIKNAKKDKGEDEKASTVNLADYQGTYDNQPWGDEGYFMPWGGKLVNFSLRSNNPIEAMTKFEHIEGDVFARLRDDGTTAETVTFFRDEDGKVTKYKIHGTMTPKKN
jgi:CubicO group peptidase (beta-lactamase class C family)